MKSHTTSWFSAATISGIFLAALAGKLAGAPGPLSAAVAPYIIEDTITDSPGTNIVTRVVTFSAQFGGTPPPALQWKVNKGSGFVSIRGATNATYRIANAQVEHSGLYSLFATNSAGATNSTPQSLFVSEGVD